MIRLRTILMILALALFAATAGVAMFRLAYNARNCLDAWRTFNASGGMLDVLECRALLLGEAIP